MAVDWLAIKTEYINGGISYRKLAEKYGVNKDSIAARAKAENWKGLRDNQTDKTHTKTIQKTVEKISDALSDAAANEVSIKSRIRLKIYREIENRLNAEEVDASDFRKLVQSYKDMCEIVVEDGKNKQEGVRVIVDV